MPKTLIIVVQVVAAMLFAVGIRACGTRHRPSARSGVWIAPVLWAFAAVLAAPAAAVWRKQPSAYSVAVFVTAFLIGFVIMVAVGRRPRSIPHFDPTRGDES